MATKIRLKRIGRRNRPFYRVVVMDSRNKRDGAAIEELGWFNPIDQEKTYSLDEDRILHKEKTYSLDEDRILHWLKTGAQPSDALHNLMKRSGLAHRWHLMQQGLDEKEIEKEMKKWAADREETLKRRAEKAEEKANQVKLKKAEKKKAEEEAPKEEEAPAEEEKTDEEEYTKEEEAPEEEDNSK